MFNANLATRGELKTKFIPAKRADLFWRLSNMSRPGFIFGFLANKAAKLFTKLTGVPTITADLSIRLRKANGEWINYGTVAYRLVTDVGVAFIVDDWDNDAQDITTFNFHGVGTGTNAEAAGDTTLQTESTTVLNPDSTRGTGTKSQPSANILRSVGTLTFDGSAAITEHGLFSDVDTGQGVLWDRSIFSAINVASGDSIQFTHNTTLNSGG